MMQIDVQSSFLVGSLIALVAQRRTATATRLWLAQTTGVAFAFGAGVLAPVCLYFMLRWTTWETMYLWDASTVPVWVVCLFVALVSLASPAGFVLTQRLLRSRRRGAVFAINGALLASVVLIAVVGWERVLYVGTLQGFAAGERFNILQTSLPTSFVLLALLVFLPTAISIIAWIRYSRPTPDNV